MIELRRVEILLFGKKSMILVTEIYEITRSYSKNKLFGIISQIKISAFSIQSNIAEGYDRYSIKDDLRFLKIANGSLHELQTQIEISHNIIFLDYKTLNKIYEKTKGLERMLTSMINKIC